jgi:hypothetical protein
MAVAWEVAQRSKLWRGETGVPARSELETLAALATAGFAFG